MITEPKKMDVKVLIKVQRAKILFCPDQLQTQLCSYS